MHTDYRSGQVSVSVWYICAVLIRQLCTSNIKSTVDSGILVASAEPVLLGVSMHDLKLEDPENLSGFQKTQAFRSWIVT